MTPSRAYAITGMTCDHCAHAVDEQVAAVAGVTGVEVDLGSGRMVVHGDADAGAGIAAVAEAGYEARP